MGRRVNTTVRLCFCPGCKRHRRELVADDWARRSIKRNGGFPFLMCFDCLCRAASAKSGDRKE